MKKKNLVFWLQKKQPRVFDLKRADISFFTPSLSFFLSSSESTQVFLMNNIILPPPPSKKPSRFCCDNFSLFSDATRGDAVERYIHKCKCELAFFSPSTLE